MFKIAVIISVVMIAFSVFAILVKIERMVELLARLQSDGDMTRLKLMQMQTNLSQCFGQVVGSLEHTHNVMDIRSEKLVEEAHETRERVGNLISKVEDLEVPCISDTLIDVKEDLHETRERVQTILDMNHHYYMETGIGTPWMTKEEADENYQLAMERMEVRNNESFRRIANEMFGDVPALGKTEQMVAEPTEAESEEKEVKE